MDFEGLVIKTKQPMTDVVFLDKPGIFPSDWEMKERTIVIDSNTVRSKPELVQLSNKSELLYYLRLAQNLIEDLRYREKEKSKYRRPKKLRGDQDATDFETRILQKKASIQDYYRHGETSMVKIAKLTGASTTLVKKTLVQLDLTGNFIESKRTSERKRRNRKIKEVCESLLRDHPYSTGQQIKVCLEQEGLRVGKPTIYKQLRRSGYWWKASKHTKMSLRPLNNEDRNRILDIAYHASIDFSRLKGDLIFIDEMKMVFSQIPKKHWGKKGCRYLLKHREEQYRVVVTTAIVACSLNGFISIGLTSGELSADDFHYYLATLDAHLTKNGSVDHSYVLDNAPWHRASSIVNGPFKDRLIFNAPGRPQANFIENTFSGVRNLYRSRSTPKTYSEEIHKIVTIFQAQNRPDSFINYSSNYLKFLIETVRTICSE